MGRFTLALVAHDSQKEEMVRLVKRHHESLNRMDLIATRGTGTLIQGRTGLPVTLMSSEAYGGDQQIGALIAHGKVQAVVFLRDPLTAQAHEPDIWALLRICDVYNIPLATNLATAEAVLDSLCQQHYVRAAPALA